MKRKSLAVATLTLIALACGIGVAPAKTCLKSESETLGRSIIPFWAEKCYGKEEELLNFQQLELYQEALRKNDCHNARSIYETAFRLQHPELPVEDANLQESDDWMRWIIERNAHDLFFCFVAAKARHAEAEIARLKIDAGKFPGFLEAINQGLDREVPPAVDDRNHVIIDLSFLAEANHAPAQALLLETTYVKGWNDLWPGYGLFLIERLARKGYPLGNAAELRRLAASGLPEDVIAELTALAAEHEPDFILWKLAREKAGTLPEP